MANRVYQWAFPNKNADDDGDDIVVWIFMPETRFSEVDSVIHGHFGVSGVRTDYTSRVSGIDVDMLSSPAIGNAIHHIERLLAGI